jgi:serine/threonine protein phosphatase 1
MNKIYVMSDIHGAYEQYLEIKKKINFDSTDTLYIIGDIFDRGEGTYKILSDIMNSKNIHLILGNHEYSYVQIYENMKKYEETKDNRYKEMADTWKNYISDPAAGGSSTVDFLFNKIRKTQRDKYLRYLSSCPTDKLLNVDGKNIYLTHGSISKYEMARVTDRMDMYPLYLLLFDEKKQLDAVACVNLLNINKNNEKSLNNELAQMVSEGWMTDPIIIFGHTPVKYYNKYNKDMKIIKAGNNINIDCGCNGFNFGKPDKDGFIGHLACLCLNTMEEYYI